MTVRISIRGNPFFHGFSFPSFRFILLSLKGMNEMTQEVRGLMSEGNIWKQLILFSVPLVLGNIFQQLYNAVDSMIVGNFVGKEALAAVTSSSPIINLLISFFMGLSVGAGVVIARYFGARDETGLSDSIHTSMCMIVIAGIVMTFAGVFLLCALLGVAVLLTCSLQNGIILLVMAFLISPFGLPMAAIWLLGKVQDLKFAIQDLVYG